MNASYACISILFPLIGSMEEKEAFTKILSSEHRSRRAFDPIDDYKVEGLPREFNGQASDRT